MFNLSSTITCWVKQTLFLSAIALFTPLHSHAQDFPYQAVRLNDGNPIITPSMFSNSNDGISINGPSLIRVPDWIPANRRVNSNAQYYLYFADHDGAYIRMAWAADIEGPYRLYDDFTSPGDRGVLDNAGDDIFLDNGVRIEENHLASPDVHVDNENQRIIMYFHSGSSFFVNNSEQNRQVTWVSTSPYGLEFFDNIESAHLGTSYFKVFEANGDLYSLDNSAGINRAPSLNNPWSAPNGHDFTDRLWDRNPSGDVFQDDIPLPSADLRVRHTGVHVDGDTLLAFYSRRGEFQERIQLSTVDIDRDWSDWDPTYPPIEILAPNPGWEGGERTMENSETSFGVNVNQLRDPDVFRDNDGQLYLLYSGNGEGGIGIAKLYETPSPDVTLRATADAHIRQSSNNNFGTLNSARVSTGSSSADQRRLYVRFDLSSVSNIEDARVRLFVEDTTGGPITVYRTSSNWSENSINRTNDPSLGDPITTVHLTEGNQYYEWNISDYAQENAGRELSVAFDIAPSNSADHEITSIQGGSAPELLVAARVETPTPLPTPTPTPTPTDGVQNIAPLGTASQSSTSHNGSASRAIDGNSNGIYQAASTTHTTTQAQPWWQVDLGSINNISHVNLYNRTDDCCRSRLSDFYVLISDTPFTSNSLSNNLSNPNVDSFYFGPTAGDPTRININGNGRYVRVQLAGNTNPLSLAEVEVFRAVSTDVTNLSQGRPASQSSTSHNGSASRAVDGNTNGIYQSASTTHTTTQAQPWWQVDLGSISNISHVNLYNRTDDCCRSRSVSYTHLTLPTILLV